MATSIFRTQSLQKLSSPEQLDRTLKITSPRGWLLLLAFGLVAIGGIIWGFIGNIPETSVTQGILIREGGVNPIVSFHQGTIETLLIRIGDYIRKGTPVAYLRDLQGKRQIVVSPIGGQIVELWAYEGSLVPAGASIATAEYENRSLQAVLYVPVDKAKSVLPGMEVNLNPFNVPKQKYGVLKGQVKSVSDYPISTSALKALLNNDLLENTIKVMGPSAEVIVELQRDERTTSRYKWTTKQGPPFEITSGTSCIGEVILKNQKPIEMVLPIKITRDETEYKQGK